MPPVLTALNGRLPNAALTVADAGPLGSQRLRLDATASYHRMLAAGCPAGHLRSGYRDRDLQNRLHAQYLAGTGNTAAPPGSSFHGEGTAADIDEPARSWVRAHGLAYGWVKDRVRGEPWHFEYDPDRDQHKNDAPPEPEKPVDPPKPKEKKMKVIKGPNDPAWWITDGMTKRWITNEGGQPADLLRLCEQAAPVVLGQFTVDRIPVQAGTAVPK